MSPSLRCAIACPLPHGFAGLSPCFTFTNLRPGLALVFRHPVRRATLWFGKTASAIPAEDASAKPAKSPTRTILLLVTLITPPSPLALVRASSATSRPRRGPPSGGVARSVAASLHRHPVTPVRSDVYS